ncbi:MAG TPA: hypothetical protein VJL62_03025, partial [Thermodesulfobacteriota bacterium]|nr:hypothetical protein [Thermodesulfobacteriota bacterium]
SPYGLTVTSDGVWFGTGRNQKLVRFDIRTGKFKEHPLPKKLMVQTTTLDLKGNIWFSCKEENKVVRFDPATGKFTEFAIATPDSQPFGVRADKKNNIWFAELAANKLVRLDISAIDNLSKGKNLFIEIPPSKEKLIIKK